jgi:hypothetical protein
MRLQLVELEELFEALERGVAGGLLETGDMDALRNPARDRPALQVVLGEGGASRPACPAHLLTTRAIESVSIGLVPIRLRSTPAFV